MVSPRSKVVQSLLENLPTSYEPNSFISDVNGKDYQRTEFRRKKDYKTGYSFKLRVGMEEIV